MSTSSKHSATDWDELIDQFLASGQSQTDFCHQAGISRYRFAYYYRRSPKFAGKRRAAAKVTEKPVLAFRPVQLSQRPAPTPAPPSSVDADRVSITIGHDIRIECAAALALEAISRLAREHHS